MMFCTSWYPSGLTPGSGSAGRPRALGGTRRGDNHGHDGTDELPGGWDPGDEAILPKSMCRVAAISGRLWWPDSTSHRDRYPAIPTAGSCRNCATSLRTWEPS